MPQAQAQPNPLAMRTAAPGGYATAPNGTNPFGGGANIDGSGIATPGYVPISGPAITDLSQIAMSPGLSPWALAATDQQRQLKQNAIDQGNQSVAGSTAGADANLAANGGLSSGARERAAETGMKNNIAMVQDTNRQQGINDMQIGMNDTQNKLTGLGTVANVEQANATAANAYNQNTYDQQMQAWAANQQADATRNSGKK